MRVLSLPGRHYPVNPYFLYFCDGLEGEGVEIVDIRSKDALLLKFDIVHIHFPEHYVVEHNLLNALKWTAIHGALFLASKLCGKKFVRTVHDVVPFRRRHEWLLKPFMRFVDWLVDAHVFMAQSSKTEFFKHYPSAAKKPSCVVEHGPYDVPHTDTKRLADLRATLEGGVQNPFIVGFLGNIKPYKGIGAIVHIPETLSNGRNVRIVLAGKYYEDTEVEVEGAFEGMGPERLLHIDERVSDEKLNQLIQAVDLVFLPYKLGWNSGLGLLVLSNKARFLSSSLPVFSDMKEMFGEPWVYQYDNPQDIRGILDVIESNTPKTGDIADLEKKLSGISFEAGSKKLKAFYESLLPSSKG